MHKINLLSRLHSRPRSNRSLAAKVEETFHLPLTQTEIESILSPLNLYEEMEHKASKLMCLQQLQARFSGKIEF